MMKKIIALILAAVCVFALAGCGGSSGEESAAPEIAAASPEELLNKVWESTPEDQQFMVMGGDPSNTVENMAGSFDMSMSEEMANLLHVNAETAALADSAASMLHGMNLNTFTSAAFHIADAADMDSFVSGVKDGIMDTQWMCGFPDTLVIYTLGDYAVFAFGNAEIIDSFKANLETVYADAAVLAVEESLA